MSGIPNEMLAELEDAIWRGLLATTSAAQEWRERLRSAIRPGQDLSRVSWQLLHWLLTASSVNPGITHPVVADAVAQCARAIEPLTRGEDADRDTASRKAENAWKAVQSVRSAKIASSAARSAASAAESAAASSPRAAAAIATSALSSVANWSPAAWQRIANKLIELIKEAP